jgi:hypothetical protein
MSKIEKTLELNITHEILSLADSFWWYLQPISLKRYWRPHWRFPFIQTPKSYALGLPINLEGKTGGGWDVCIKSPPNFQFGNARSLFMQFKAGEEKQFNSDRNSIFYGDSSNPNIHVEFEINSNKNHNQHKLLTDIAAKAGNEDAAVYVFPRIVDEDQLIKNNGDLLSKTSFISISDINLKAKNAGLTIDDGRSHKFRTCYYNYNRNEINYFFFNFGKPNRPGGVVGEIFSIRMYRALRSLQDVQLKGFTISKWHVIDAMIRHIYNIGLYFAIPLESVRKSIGNYPSIIKRLEYHDQYHDLASFYKVEVASSEYVVEIFYDIILSLSKYFQWIEEIQYFEKSISIPLPPAAFTIEVPKDGIRFSLNENNKLSEPEDIDEIFYQLI